MLWLRKRLIGVVLAAIGVSVVVVRERRRKRVDLAVRLRRRHDAEHDRAPRREVERPVAAEANFDRITGAPNGICQGTGLRASASRGPTTTTSAQRTFSLDDTLSSLAVTIGRGGFPAATFELTRPATVVVQIQRPNGVPVGTLRSGQQAAGPEHATWHGRIGRRRAPNGHYQVVVQATSSVGTSSLAAPFSLRAHARH